MSKATKTPFMLLIEYKYQKPIEEMLLDGSLRKVSGKLGVSHTTVSKWITRLGLGATSHAA